MTGGNKWWKSNCDCVSGSGRWSINGTCRSFAQCCHIYYCKMTHLPLSVLQSSRLCGTSWFLLIVKKYWQIAKSGVYCTQAMKYRAHRGVADGAFSRGCAATSSRSRRSLRRTKMLKRKPPCFARRLLLRIGKIMRHKIPEKIIVKPFLHDRRA